MQEQFMTSWQNMLNRLTSWMDIAITNLPNFVIAIFVFSVSYWISRKVRYWLAKPLARIITQTSVLSLITSVAASLVGLLGILLGLSILNLDTVLQSLLAGAGVMGLAVGLALKDSFSNTFSGIVLSIKDVINIGDYIETNGYAGIVEEITLRSTTIKETDNNMVIIPNSTVLSNPIKNYALTNRMKLCLECRVDYQANLREIRFIIMGMLEQNFPQDKEEKIEFQYLSFAKSAIEFQVRFWVNSTDKTTLLEHQSEAILLIKEILDQHQIQIPMPLQKIQFGNDEIRQNGSSVIYPTT